jgi:hypothetical protein
MVNVTLVEIEANVKINKCSSVRAIDSGVGLGSSLFRFSFDFANMTMSVAAVISSAAGFDQCANDSLLINSYIRFFYSLLLLLLLLLFVLLALLFIL